VPWDNNNNNDNSSSCITHLHGCMGISACLSYVGKMPLISLGGQELAKDN
jgi:hypothetical protein